MMAKGRQGPFCLGFSLIRRREAMRDSRKSLSYFDFFRFSEIVPGVTFGGRSPGRSTKI
jgi:hypothetical protein